MRGLCIALLVAACASTSESEDGTADSSEGIADTGTDSATLTSSMSDTTPTVTTDDPTLTTSVSSSETESETEVTSETDPTTGPTGCVTSLECTDPGSPVCVDEVCSPCGDAADGDAACEAKDPDAPACRGDGECVQCTPANPSSCEDVTPICDGGSSSCVGCTEHEQCAAGACLLDTGACFDEGCEVQINPGDDIENEAMDGCVLHIHAGAYAQSVTVSGGTVALLAAGDGDATLAGETANGSTSLTVTNGATVYVEGLLINGNDAGGIGVEVDNAFVWMDRTQVGANTGGGIALSNGANAHVRNCFVGGSINNLAALDVTGSTIDLRYSTLGGGFGATAAALRCDAGSTVNVRNSLLVAETNAPEVACVTDSFDNNATEAELEEMNTNWFVGWAEGDFSLNVANAPAEILTTAVWNTEDPLVDIDDEPRPNVDGTADVAGADVP